DHVLFPWAYGSVADAVRIARKKAGWDPNLQLTHAFRKHFEGAFDRLGSEGKIDHHKKLQIEGHSQGVRKFYTDREIGELRELYKKAYPYLDLSEKAVVDATTKDLKDQNRRLQEQLDELRDHDRRIRKLEVLRGSLEDVIVK